VAHACNPSYSGGSWFKARPGKQFIRPYLKKTHQKKRTGGVAQGIEPEFKPEYHKERGGEEERRKGGKEERRKGKGKRKGREGRGGEGREKGKGRKGKASEARCW
jgi:hypothetical protein